MRFLGRNRNKSGADIPTAAEASNSLDEHTGGDAGRFGFISRISGKLLDSRNSRFRAMFESSMPERMTIVQILLGMVIGMITAYLIIPTEFAGASPRHLSSNAIAQWVRMIAVGHSEAIHYDDANTLLVLQRIPNPQQVVDQLANNPQIHESEQEALNNLKAIPGFDELTGTRAPVDPGIAASGAQILLALVVVAVGVPVVALIWRELIFAKVVAPAASRAWPAPDPEAAAAQSQTKAPETLPEQQWLAEETERSGLVHAEFGVPVLHTLSSYTKGRNYDDSFAIELGPEQGSEFLGECGVSAATKVGNELQSVELWVFDMASQETFAKVFAAPAALNDPAFQATVASRVTNPATDIAAAEPGAELLLDTNAMRIRARINTIIYNYGGGAPSSGIENLQIELLAWQKQGRGFSAGGGYTDMQFAPPSQMPSTLPTPPPPAGGQSAGTFDSSPFDTTRQTPSKPSRRPEDEEDDPFGGSGNFMPSS